jgi:hypothetical protein
MIRSLKWVGRALVVLGVTSLLLAPAAVAWAQTYPTPPGPTDPCTPNGLPVIGVSNGVDVCGARVAAVHTAAQPSTSSGALAFTGADIALLVVLGAVVLGGGLVLVRVSRRPKAVI